MRILLLLISVMSFTVEVQAIGELWGNSRRLAVERETLYIDFRPLLDKGEPRARIDAIYQIVNSGEPETEQLFLAAQTAKVEFDGLPVELKSAVLRPPLDFRPSDTTPGLAQQPPIYYSTTIPNEGLSFTLTVPRGQHQLRISYSIQPQAKSLSSPSIFWQLGYVLAPGRQWASYGGLDLYIYLPPNWEGACNLPVERGRDMLVGAWNALPQDNIALTLRQIPPQLLRYSYAAVASSLLLCVCGVLLLGHFGWLKRHFLLSLASVSAVSTAIFTTSYMLDLMALKQNLGSQFSNAYSSGLYSATLLAAVFSLSACSTTVAGMRLRRVLASSSNT